ncbi:hypothetical protein FRC07_012273 [Ceratobasidium sp. 392]|nr:hypothetical protein FRC07_012273 [Ceratobasidium sp. 392]
MASRQGSVSLHSLDSPPSQARLAYPLVSQPSSSMHDPHASATMLDFSSQRYSVDPYGVGAASPPHDYAMHSPMQTAHSVGGHSAGAVRPKRKQVKNACSACQRACKRCDVGRPCERCIKYGMQDSCRDSLRKERKKGVKRGPYKKRDGESALAQAPGSMADVAPPGMLNELQRMNNMPTKTRTSRVSSISEVQSQASTSQMDQSASAAAVPLFIQSVPSARPSEGAFPYSTSIMIPAPTQHPSLASMHSSSSHANMHHSTRSEDQYYQPRYDHLGSTRPSHFRMDSYPAQQEYQTKPVPQMVDHRSMRALQYPSSEDSPPRERQYSSQMYNDNRHAMIPASSTHPDVSYQSQSEPVHDSPRTIEAHYSYANQQHQRSYERGYQERSYGSDAHMQDSQQEIQQPQQQYYPYNAYQNQSSSSYAPYGYSQNSASHAMAPAQHVADQADPAYMNRAAAPDQVSYGSSINSYPEQQQQSYPSQHSPQHSMSNGVQYAMRSARIMHRDMVAHPHVGNVQVQSN